jgi:hypothetical protein
MDRVPVTKFHVADTFPRIHRPPNPGAECYISTFFKFGKKLYMYEYLSPCNVGQPDLLCQTRNLVSCIYILWMDTVWVLFDFSLMFELNSAFGMRNVLHQNRP